MTVTRIGTEGTGIRNKGPKKTGFEREKNNQKKSISSNLSRTSNRRPYPIEGDEEGENSLLRLGPENREHREAGTGRSAEGQNCLVS